MDRRNALKVSLGALVGLPAAVESQQPPGSSGRDQYLELKGGFAGRSGARAMAKIDLEQLQKSFGKHTAVQSLDLTIENGRLEPFDIDHNVWILGQENLCQFPLAIGQSVSSRRLSQHDLTPSL